MNWKAEAKEKLRRYDAMRLAIINIPEELNRLEVDAQSIRTANFEAVSTGSTAGRREDALLNNILERQELELALQQARIWLQTTDRALTALNPEEKLLLHKLYIYPETGNLERLCKELDLEPSSIYRHRDRALKHFTLAYYGIDI